jgi:putative ABC transport system permease protein
VPLGTQTLIAGSERLLDSRSSWFLKVMVRLARGQSAEQATAALRAIQPRIADETRPSDWRPQDAAEYLAAPFTLAPASTGSSDLRASYERPVVILMGIVTLTLLIACGNIANLLLARANARRHELSVRTALGATGWRLARQLFTESMLLSTVGAALGVVFAHWGSRLVVSQLSAATDQVFLDTAVNWRTLIFTTVMAVGTALIFGTVPALRASRAAPGEAMKEHGRATSSGRRPGLAGALVVTQVALSLVLLVGAGLFVRTFASLAHVDLGFERDRALVVRIGTHRASLDSSARREVYERLRRAALALPQVSDAALSITLPVSDNTLILRMDFPGRPALSDRERLVYRNVVSPGFFATLGMPLLAGRDFDHRDRAGGPRTVIVNRAFVEKYFAGENPIGRVITESRDDPRANLRPLEIVGVVGDAIYRSLRTPPPPTMYWPLAQVTPPSGVTLTVRAATSPPVSLTRRVADALTMVNPDLALTFRPLADQVNASITRERLLAQLSVLFGALALLLSALGVYGITSYAVSSRRIELGIRMALGTSPLGVVRLVLARLALLVTGGVAIGIAASWWAAKFAETLVFGLTPRDPATMAVAITILVAIATVAGWVPARRAARIDPARVLREG